MMDDDLLSALIKRRVEAAGTTETQSQLSSDRQRFLERYRGDPLGDEVDGRSQVVSKDVLEVIEGAMPGLVKVFASGDTIIRFEPRQPGDEAGAQQATEYINYLFLEQCDGYKFIQAAIKDGLLFRTGVGKVWHDGTPEITREQYRDLSDDQFAMLEADESIEIAEHEETTEDIELPPGMTVEMAAIAGVSMQRTLHSVTIRRTNVDGRPRIANVAPDEFGIDTRAISLEQAEPGSAVMVWQRTRQTVSELADEFPKHRDTIESAAGYEDDITSGERQTRFQDEGTTEDEDWADITTRYVTRIDAFIRADYDDDGTAELRFVTCVGDSAYSILQNEEVDDNIFAAWSPVLMPHKFHGMSLAEMVEDVQVVKTATQRLILDSGYFSLNPRTQIIEGKVDLDDLLNVRSGGVVRTYGPTLDTMRPIDHRFIGADAFPMLEYWDNTRELRSGVPRYSSGLNPDSLNKFANTATGATIIQDGSQQRQELIARNFAELFLKRVFKLLLKCVLQYPNAHKFMRLRGQLVPIDPRSWKTNYDMTVTVGLGTGNRDTQVSQLMALLQLDGQAITLMQGLPPWLTASNIHAKFEKLCEVMGLKGKEQYYTDPATVQQAPQQPQMDPRIVEIQAKAELQGAKDKMDHEYRMAQLSKDLQVEQLKAQLETGVKQWSAVEDVKTDRFKAGADVELKREVANHDANLKHSVADHDARLKGAVADHDAGLKRDSHETDKEIKKSTSDVNNRAKAESAGISVKVAKGEDFSAVEDRVAAIADQQAETAKKIDKIADALMLLAKPKRAVKRNGAWEQEFIN